MARINALSPDTADGKSRALMEKVQEQMGMVPNLLRTMGHSPAVLGAYLGFSGALAGSTISKKLREQIALLVSQDNECDYCLAAHSAVGRMTGLSEEDLRDSRRGVSPDSKTGAALQFAHQLINSRGWVSDADLKDVHAAGLGDAEILEIIATVFLVMFTNYVSHVAEPDVDFPPAAEMPDVGRDENDTRLRADPVASQKSRA